MNDWQSVVTYTIGYAPATGTGSIRLVLEDQDQAQIKTGSLAELTALADLLRREKPIYYDRMNDVLSTGPEPVGEQE